MVVVVDAAPSDDVDVVAASVDVDGVLVVTDTVLSDDCGDAVTVTDESVDDGVLVVMDAVFPDGCEDTVIVTGEFVEDVLVDDDVSDDCEDVVVVVGQLVVKADVVLVAVVVDEESAGVEGTQIDG